MLAQSQLKTPITPEDYLAFERKAEEKHEFVDGIIYAMSGASREHNEITGNLFGELWTRFKKTPCRVYMNDMRVKINETDYVYPDVVGLCDDIQLEDEQFDTLVNPALIIEVLSKSTQNYDKNKKMTLYQSLPTVQDYVLVSQDEYRVEHYQRKSQNQWLFTVLTEPQQILQLNSVNAEISLQDIYDRVTLDKS